jgi:putative tryptophan/tyrosine transport system substrate-binding protein
VRRREFISLLGGATAAWPLLARAQQTERMRRIGVLMYQDESDPEATVRFSGFTQALSELGWTDGRNLRMDVRWAGASVDRTWMFAKELVDLQPSVILVNSTPTTAALQRQTRTIPVVFVGLADPVGEGFVAGLPHPGGNLTGLINVEPTMVSKWLELLTEIAPGVKRAAIMFNPYASPFFQSYYLPPFESAARSLKVEPIAAPVYGDAEIETVITSLGNHPGGGLVAPSDSWMAVRRKSIISLATRTNVPAVYSQTAYVKDGGLLSYGPDYRDMYRRAAPYVDRILRGEKPADLPVQMPVKFEMALNATTAKALGLEIPPMLLARADEVIE